MKGRNDMKEITLNVEGMTCCGCEKRLQNALSEIDGVADVQASHTDKKVTITLNKEIDINILKETITDLDFEVK